MENKQMDKRHQRADDKSNKSNQKTTNGFKNSTKDQQKQNVDKSGSNTGSDWNSKNQQPASGRSDHNKHGSETNHSQTGSSETRSDHQSHNPQTQKNQTGRDQEKWEGQDMNHPTNEKPFSPSEGQYNQNPKRNRDTESPGVLDEDRGPFQDEETDHLQQNSYGESIDTENSNIDSPKKKNQNPPSKFS